jgi:general secretion pathway protein D
VGVFRLENSTAATVIGELDQIFETADNGLGRDLIKFRPIERLNAVMAVSKRRELVERAGAWVRRLDASSTTSPHVYVYQLRYGDAKSIAGILSDMFGGGQSATQPVSPDSNIAVAVTAPPTDQSAPPTDQFGNPVPAPSPDTSASTPPSSPSSSAPGSNTGVKISADLSNNSLVILADGDTYKKIQAALRQIDIPRLQVAVHAIVAEVTLNDALKNGVEFFLKSSNLGLGTDAGSIGFGTTSVLKRVIPGFNFLLGSAKDPQLVLSALDTVTNVKIISSPSIVVTNNQKATLQVGAQVPVATREATDVTDPNAPIVNNIEFRDTGVILKVTPKINDNGVVNMDIEQEISAVSKESAAGTLTPVISTRKVSSSISVVSGQTVVLGGLISEQSDTTANGLPYLNRLKFLGILGGKRTLDHTRTEIIMFIRPEIIRNGGDAENVTNDMALQLRDMIGPGSGDANQISK